MRSSRSQGTLRVAPVALSLSLVFLAACAGEPDAVTDDSSALVTRISGAGLGSPNAKPNATYLAARSLRTLREIGALDPALDALAARVDGVLANRPADETLAVSELLEIEKPARLATLHAAERARLADLWALLETSDRAPAKIALAPVAPAHVTSLSTPAGPPVPAPMLRLADLVEAHRSAASRLELTTNDDGDPQTISSADLDVALADPGSYTPADVTVFRQLKLYYLDNARTPLRAVARVEAPEAMRPLWSEGAVTLAIVRQISYVERRSLPITSPSGAEKERTFRGEARETPALALAEATHALFLDESTGKEILAQRAFTLPASTYTVEAWNHGKRVLSTRATLPELGVRTTSSDLRDVADHRLELPDGSVLTPKSTCGDDGSVTVSWGPGTAVECAPSRRSMQRDSAPPALPVTPGRYDIAAGALGEVTLDVYPEGFFRVTIPGKGDWRGNLVWAPLRILQRARTLEGHTVELDSKGSLEIRTPDGRNAFRGPLTSWQLRRW